MELCEETIIEIKKSIINTCDSIKDDRTVFQEGMYIGQIIAYTRILGIYPPDNMCKPSEIFEWAKDTFK